MINIFIPNNNIQERKYVIDILIGEFLGLTYEVTVDSGIDSWNIVLENGNKLVIQDHFFNKFKKDLEYLDEKNIPKKIEFSKNDFIVENDIPVIYGNSQFSIFNSQLIKCGVDIFASSFFMLTRWEEYVNKIRDKHNRFPAYASLAYKNNFLDRPIVNEYVEMLWNMLRFLGCKQEREKREFKFVLTHDVDVAYKYMNLLSGVREIIGDILKRKNLYLAFENLSNKILSHLKLKKDPFDTYDYLMDISESIGVKSYFFLHSSNNAKEDVDNDKFLKEIASKILNRGHFLGYHPSYDAYNNYELFVNDKEKMENIIKQKLTFGRQHYLRFEVPTTWQIWEEAEMEWDSSIGYSGVNGFRSGICFEYSVFDILRRKKLNLKEKPLIIMDVSIKNLDYELKLIQEIKKYNGESVILWHNSSFNTTYWEKRNFYERLLNV